MNTFSLRQISKVHNQQHKSAGFCHVSNMPFCIVSLEAIVSSGDPSCQGSSQDKVEKAPVSVSRPEYRMGHMV